MLGRGAGKICWKDVQGSRAGKSGRDDMGRRAGKSCREDMGRRAGKTCMEDMGRRAREDVNAVKTCREDLYVCRSFHSVHL